MTTTTIKVSTFRNSPLKALGGDPGSPSWRCVVDDGEHFFAADGESEAKALAVALKMLADFYAKTVLA